MDRKPKDSSDNRGNDAARKRLQARLDGKQSGSGKRADRDSKGKAHVPVILQSMGEGGSGSGSAGKGGFSARSGRGSGRRAALGSARSGRGFDAGRGSAVAQVPSLVLSLLGALASGVVKLVGFCASTRIPNTRIPIGIVVIALALALCLFGVNSCNESKRAAEEEAAAQAAASQQVDQNRVSFLAVGDNLPDKVIGEWADAQSGSSGDGSYDYAGLYSHIKDYVQAADLSYVDEESVVGGNEIGPVGYPTFNTTDEMADALESTGFDLVGAASNHTNDHGTSAVKHAASVLNSKSFTMVGINESKKKAMSYKLVKSKNISFAFLDYTYGLNDGTSGVSDWLINVYGEDRLNADVSAARKEADVVIVAMHWGTEKQTEPDSEEKKYAQILADAGADIVIGSHPHVIQPMEWLKGSGGNKTLVAYSLGNFLSNHDNSNTLPQLEGMVTCDFVKDESTGSVSIENVTFVPLVNHRVLADKAADCEFGVYALKDYTSELAKKHSDFGDLDDPIAWLKQQVDQIMGSDFTIDY